MNYNRVIADQHPHWDDVFASCRAHGGTMFVTMDGEEDDLVIMTRTAYEQMSARFQLYALLEEGMEDVRNGRVIPAREALEKLREELKNEFQ